MYKKDIHQELKLLRMSIKAMRDEINRELDHMSTRIDILLPAEDDSRHLRYKNFTKKDWANFLDQPHRRQTAA